MLCFCFICHLFIFNPHRPLVSMITFFSNFISFYSGNLRNFVLLIFLSLLSSFLEAFSLASILPLVSLFSDQNESPLPFFGSLFQSLSPPEILVFIVLIFTLKFFLQLLLAFLTLFLPIHFAFSRKKTYWIRPVFIIFASF